MANSQLHLKKAREIADLVNNGKITAVEVAKYFLERAKILDEKVNAFNSFTTELALKQAAEVDQKIKNGEKLLLAGVPIAIKDNICVQNTKTTCSSKMLENFIAPYESTVTSKLWAAGAICIGKTNLDEFAMGSSTEHSAFGPTRNPWDLNRVPGGSSGGSAAAVASRIVPLSLGSDTGGSIRQPAGLCGIVGLKPSYGFISRFGLIAFASSLDQIGPFATDLEDAQLLLSVIAGHDPKDSTSLKNTPAFKAQIENKSNLKNLKIGLIKELMLNEENAPADLVLKFNESIKSLKLAGAEIKEVSLPISTAHALDVYYIVAPAEASSNLARYDGVRYGYRDETALSLNPMYAQTRAKGFGKEVIRRIMIGTYALSSGYYDAYYKKALQVRRLISEEFEKVFTEFDVLISPTSPMTAFPFGDKLNDPLAMYLCDIATIPANLAGLPAISINCGFDEKNLPIGFQLMAAHGQDEKLMDASFDFQNIFKNSSNIQSQIPSIAL